MDDFLSLLLMGSIIPTLAFVVKKVIIEKAISTLWNEFSIKSENGKELKFIAKIDISSNEIKKIIESELSFETEVKKHLSHFITSHKKLDLELSHGKYVDFIMSYGDRIIGIEAKSNAERFNAKWISEYFKENDGINDLIMIVDSKIPMKIINEVKQFDSDKRIRLISSPKGKDLSKLIDNVLTTDLGLKK